MKARHTHGATLPLSPQSTGRRRAPIRVNSPPACPAVRDDKSPLPPGLDPPVKRSSLVDKEGRMLSPAPSVVSLPANSVDRAARVLTRAFMEDPIYVGILPDADKRRRAMQALWQGVIRTCRPYGRVDTTPDLAGVTCWLAPGHADLNAWQVLRTGLALPRAMMAWPPAARRRFLQLVTDVDRIRQARLGQPCWYLWALGVEPDRQGQGIGGTLINSVHRLADTQHLPCYLETETEANVRWYGKRGYRVVFEGDIVGLRLWSLLRAPRSIEAEPATPG